MLKPRLFRTAVAYRLGVPLLKEEISCPLCEQHINKYAITPLAAQGEAASSLGTTHSATSSTVSRPMLSPIAEKKGILGPTSGRRPGDVTIPVWSEGKGLAID